MGMTMIENLLKFKLTITNLLEGLMREIVKFIEHDNFFYPTCTVILNRKKWKKKMLKTMMAQGYVLNVRHK